MTADGAPLGAPSVVSAPGVTVRVEPGGSVGLAADLVVTLTAERDLTALATGRFASPACGARWARDDLPEDVELLGFALTQFALPVTAGRDLDFDLAPAPGLRSPRAVLPLVARRAGRVALLAPIDHAHEQVVAVTDDGLLAGWHGDLDEVPAGFATRLGAYSGGSLAEALSAWRADLDPAPVERRDRGPLLTHLSYWTDNGAAYWYRTEPGSTIAASVAEVVEDLRARGVPIRAVELDSWFYDHEVPRPIREVGYPEEVPPTGATSWTPRADAFDPPPDDGADLDPIERFAERLGRPPLVLHARHVSPRSPAVDGTWWVDEHAAMPSDPGWFRRWFDDAARWGATCVEQDWMLMWWYGVRPLRAAPGRAATWQRALDRHADATDLDLLWCMATPADLVLASSLERVAAVRTCDDYRFADDPALLWTWFLTVNRLVGALGLAPFKDCSFTNAEVGEGSDAIDGDRHAWLEAALAALSGGPVGIGDRLGRTDRAVVEAMCDDDGWLRRVDGPIAAIDRCLFGAPARGEGLLWATTTATDAHGRRWAYVLAVNVATDGRPVVDRLRADELADAVGGAVEAATGAPAGAAVGVAWDWRAGERTDAGDGLGVELDGRDWSLWVVALDGAPAADEVGDVRRLVVVPAAG